MTEIDIEIDGQPLKAKPNQTVIEVADEAGIYIPRFCYHKHLSIPANCRMCLVEVEKAPKPAPACATPVMPGMKVFTRSAKTIAAQRSVMEFLLINHPLDCPICDQGGECELQDLAMGYGSCHSHYNEPKRAVADENLGPLISTEMTRCILCSRCIRFGDEVAGVRELGMTFRGEHEQVSTFVKHAMTSEISGNIIDLCPVGALTSKPYRFTARPWELKQYPSVSPHDCLGSNLNVHTRDGGVMRVVSREHAEINQTWISDRDRFSYTGLDHADRLDKPKIKVNGVWETTSWQIALETAARGIQQVIAKHGSIHLGALISPSATTEECYLLQKIVRGLGSNHIDHRLREIDVSDQESQPLLPGMTISLDALSQCDVALLIGSYLPKEQPLIAVRLRQAIKNGAKILAVNSVDYPFHFDLFAKNIIAPQHMVTALQNILSQLESNESTDSEIKTMVSVLKNSQRAALILGGAALHHPQAATIRYLAARIAKLINGSVNLMTDGGNSAGACLAGALPHRAVNGKACDKSGLHAYAMLEQPRKGLILVNVEPEYDTANPALAREALQQAEFVVALSQFQDDCLDDHAHVILPMAAFTESAGTYVNVLGIPQGIQGVAVPFGESRPGWKILRVLGNFLQLDGFNYDNQVDVWLELKSAVMPAGMIPRDWMPASAGMTQKEKGLYRIGDIPLYAVDPLVRRALPLQHAQIHVEGDVSLMRLHPETARKYKLKEGDKIKVKQKSAVAGPFSVALDARIAENAVWLAGGTPAAVGLGDLFGSLTIQEKGQDQC